MTTPRIAVIGAGTAGSGAALRAAQLGIPDVVLLERGHAASGSSGLSAGVYNVQTTDPLHIEIRARAREIMFRLEAKGLLHLSRIGNIRVAYTDDDIARLETALAFQRSIGVEDSQIIDRSTLQSLVPDLVTTDLAGGLYGPNDGSLDGHQLCDALIAEAKELGVRVRLNTDVVGHTKKGTVHVLHTGNGDIEADIVINAAGPWAGKVAEMLSTHLPVIPQVHEVVQVKLPRQLDYTVPMVNLYMPGMDGEALYFRQDGPDSLIAGMHTYVFQEELATADPDAYRKKVSDDYVYSVAEALHHRFLVDDLGFKPGWTGLYPISPDGNFLIGPQREDETVIACGGLGGVGVTSGAIAGYTAAEWAVCGTPTTIPALTAMSLDRLPTMEGTPS